MDNNEKIKNATQKAAFRKWFNQKWSEWDAKEGRRTTQQELADYLEITRSSVAQYTNGLKIAEGRNLRKIARRFGDEVYALFELETSRDDFSLFPPSLAARLRAASDEIEDLLNSGKVVPGSPEHEAAARAIFARHGLELNEIEIED